MAVVIFKIAPAQSRLHPINDVPGDLFTLGLEEEVVQEAIVEFDVFVPGGCLSV